MRKIAVNITEAYDLEEVHRNIVHFLYPVYQDYLNDVGQNLIRIDFYICHEDVKEPTTYSAFDNTTIRSSLLVNKDKMFANVHNGKNDLVLSKCKKVFDTVYKSYINSLAIHRNIIADTYSMIISYSPGIVNHKISNHSDFIVEDNFIFGFIKEPRWLKLDYSFYVCNPATFFKLVNFWHFLRVLEDNTFKIWNWFTVIEDCEEFILPMWLNMQSIKIRQISGI